MSFAILKKTFTLKGFSFYVQLAQFRQRKAHSDGQHASKKQKKKKKASSSKDEELVQEGLDLDQSQEDVSSHSCQRGAAATADYVTVRTLHSDEMIKHDPTYATEVSVPSFGEVLFYYSVAF